MSGIAGLGMTSRRLAGFALPVALLGMVVATGTSDGSAVATRVAASPHAAFTKTEKITRDHLVNGQNQVVDSRTVSVSVSQTKDLRNRQDIHVSWTGAHPTGGIVPQPTSGFAPQEEYPVVIMMCRGQASSGKNAITPETCWTQTAPERVQLDTTSAFPPYRVDRFESAANRADQVGVPGRIPSACTSFFKSGLAQRWVPFVAASGQVFPIGPQGCAGLPPEAANLSNNLAPGNTTYGVTDLKGNGSTSFVITTAETNASLGCSAKVACSLVVIPIMGISCDAAANSLPPADRPPSPTAAFAECSQTGNYAPGQIATPSQLTGHFESLAVSGELWWSASNWRNRIMVPLTFAAPSNVCALVNSSTPVQIFGSYLLLGATQQWEPHFCLNRKLFSLEHVITSEPEAQNFLQAGTIDAAFQGAPPETPFTGPVVQAPTAVTGFAIVFDIVDKNGQQFTTLRLDARLLAKLLTESYAETTAMFGDKAIQNPTTGLPNPLNISDDPEFRALNPGIPTVIGDLAIASSATLLVQSADSDAMWSLSSYINSDPEARAWLNGRPDPWGMVVNSKYKGIKLPVTQWPLLDTYVPPTLAQQGIDPCLAASKIPWLSLVASPVESMATITLDLQYNVSDSEIGCNDGTPPSFESVGQEIPGQTFILGLTSLADAHQFGLNTASLETQGGSTSNAKFSTSAGRSFAAPSDESMRAAVAMMQPDPTIGSWTVPYSRMRTAVAGKSAYPGTMLISTDVLTHGVPKSLAHDYGEFLSFVAGAGQRPGFANGDLPPGYLPMTAAAGAAKMIAYTRLATSDVAAQNSKVPVPGQAGKQTGPGPSPSPSPTSSSGSGGSGSSVSPSPSVPGGHPSVGASASPSPGPLPAISTSPGSAVQPLQTTGFVRSTLAGNLLPIVLLSALVIGTVAFGAWQIKRPTEPYDGP